MENTIENQFNELSKSLQELVENRIRLFKIVLVEKIARSLYMLAFLVILLFILSLVLVFASVSLATWLNAALGNIYSGYLIVTGIYIVLLVVFVAFRKFWLLNPLTRSIYNIIIPEETTDNEYDKAA